MDLSELLIIDDSVFIELFENRSPCVKTNERDVNEILLEACKIISENCVKAAFINAHLICKDYPYRHQCGGIELFKHLRLTEKLQEKNLPTCLLPVILGTLLPPEEYIRKSPDNALILTPGCECLFLLDLSDTNALDEMFDRLTPFKNYEEVVNNVLKKFTPGLFYFKKFIDLEHGEVPSRHDIRNILGPYIFLKEFLPNIENDDPLVEKYKNISGKLPTKWLNLFGKSFLGGTKAEPELRNVSLRDGNNINQKRYILVDDEHDVGWSYALYKGIFNISDNYQGVYKGLGKRGDFLLCRGDSQEIEDFTDVGSAVNGVLNYNGGFLLCINSYEKARNFFEKIKNKFDDTLKKWKHEDTKFLKQLRNNIINGRQETIDRRSKLNEELKKFPPYDLVFLDVRLEGDRNINKDICETGGIKLLNKIKELNYGTPVVLFTASERAETYKEALSRLADDYWVKCIDHGSKLRDIIGKLSKEDYTKLTKIWVRISQFQKKEWFWQWQWEGTYNRGSRTMEWEVTRVFTSRKGNREKNLLGEISLLLEQAFFFLRYGTRQDFKKGDVGYIPSLVCTLLGKIQEIRHYSTKNQEFGKLKPVAINNNNNLLGKLEKLLDKEKDLKAARNAASHYYLLKLWDEKLPAKPPTYKAAMEGLLHTLDALLDLEDGLPRNLNFESTQGNNPR